MSEVSEQPTFLALYSDGRVVADDIDDFIDRWHSEQPRVEGRIVPVSEFLGMTRDEYAAWLHDASVLPQIVQARLSHLS
jgi:hypothetical protein